MSQKTLGDMEDISDITLEQNHSVCTFDLGFMGLGRGPLIL